MLSARVDACKVSACKWNVSTRVWLRMGVVCSVYKLRVGCENFSFDYEDDDDVDDDFVARRREERKALW